jgi:hypothetical protein
LKPEWTFRWLLDPAQIAPGTAMPTGLFKKDQDRWVVNLPNPPQDVVNYHNDHARLLVRYMFLMTPDEQKRLLSATPAAPKTPPAGAPPAPQKTGRNGVSSGSGSDRVIARQRRSKRAPRTLAQLHYAHRVRRVQKSHLK